MPLKAKKTRTKRRQRLNSEARATDIRRGAMVSAWAIAGAPSELGGRSVSLPCGDDLLHVGFCALGALSEGSFELRTVWTARALRSLCHCRRRAGRAELPRQLSWALELGGSGVVRFLRRSTPAHTARILPLIRATVTVGRTLLAEVPVQLCGGGCTRTSIAAAEALASLGTATPGALATVCAAAVLGASRVAEGFVACSILCRGDRSSRGRHVLGGRRHELSARRRRLHANRTRSV